MTTPTNQRAVSPEFLESSDFDALISANGGYTLGLGYCYVKQLSDLKLFEKAGLKYFFFQTKWGRCGTTFLFSALRPDQIIFLSAWGNAAATCGTTETLFRLWREILKNIGSMDVPILMVDLPAAFHLCEIDQKTISLDRVKERRALYKKEVLNGLQNTTYIDLFYHVPLDWVMINENSQPGPFTSPWHMRKELIEYIFKHFLDFKRGCFNEQVFLAELLNLKPTGATQNG